MYSKLYHHRGMPVLGYTTRLHLLLDLDNTSLPYAKKIVRKIMWEWPKVGNCLILLSSGKEDKVRLIYNKWGRPLLVHDRGNYHLVFDNTIGYNLCCRICRVLAGLGILNADYVKIREFRGDMTLRVSPAYLQNEIKPIPKEVAYVYNNYTYRNDDFIQYYRQIKKSVELLFTPYHKAERQTNDKGYGTNNRSKKDAIDTGL